MGTFACGGCGSAVSSEGTCCREALWRCGFHLREAAPTELCPAGASLLSSSVPVETSSPSCFPQGLRGGWVPFTRLHVQPWVAPLVGLHRPHQNLKFVHVSLPASGEHWEVGSSAGCHSFHGQPQSLRAPDSPATAVLQGAHA